MENNVTQEKELILKDIYVSSITESKFLFGGLTAIYDGQSYCIVFDFKLEYGAQISKVYLEQGSCLLDCGAEIPAGPYGRLINMYTIDYINNFFTQSSNETHIFITEDDLSKSNR